MKFPLQNKFQFVVVLVCYFVHILIEIVWEFVDSVQIEVGWSTAVPSETRSRS